MSIEFTRTLPDAQPLKRPSSITLNSLVPERQRGDRMLNHQGMHADRELENGNRESEYDSGRALPLRNTARFINRSMKPPETPLRMIIDSSTAISFRLTRGRNNIPLYKAPLLQRLSRNLEQWELYRLLCSLVGCGSRFRKGLVHHW